MGDNGITGRVAAAAKLVLQDLDPEAKNRRQEFMSANPTVCLFIHIKKIKNFNKAFFKTSNFAGIQELMLYLKITIQDQSKSTRPGEVAREKKSTRRQTMKPGKLGTEKIRNPTSIADGTAEIIVDQVKGFTLDVSRRKDSIENILHFELLNLEVANKKTIEAVAESAVQRSAGTANDSKKATLMGSFDMHLWEIKTESRNEKTFTIKFKEQKICDIEIEMICLYGQFGYGYSHQLANLCDRSTFQQIEESIFFRLPGIDDRKGFDDCLVPVHIGHPDILKLKDLANIGSPALRSQLWNLSEDSACFLSENTRDCAHLQQLVTKRGRLEKMRKDYKKLPHRFERMKYLRETLMTKSKQQNTDDVRVPENEKRKSEIVRDMIDNVSPLIELSGGISMRAKQRPGPEEAEFVRESGMRKCLEVEIDSRRVSTLSNYEGSPFHMNIPAINVDENDDEPDQEHFSDQEDQERSRNFLTTAANTVRKSFSGLFRGNV